MLTNLRLFSHIEGNDFSSLDIFHHISAILCRESCKVQCSAQEHTAAQGKKRQEKARQGRQDKAGSVGQGRARQGRAGQSRAGQ